jgi:predicted nucleic acid-binding protein
VRFLDTSLLIRFFTNDDPAKAERVRTLMDRVERGEERVALSPLVVFETIFTLQRGYKLPKAQVRQMIEDLLSLRTVHLPNKQHFYAALEIYATTPLSFADAYNTVYMRSQNLTEIWSFDDDFDRLAGITRFEP